MPDCQTGGDPTVIVKNQVAYRRARELRANGLSVKEIAKKLRISLGSISPWVRDIPLTAEQRAALEARNPVGSPELQRIASAASSDMYRLRREQSRLRGRLQAQVHEPLHIKGCMLYWAEGTKNRNVVGFANTDPAMVLLFVRFIRTYWPDANFGVQVSRHPNSLTDDAVAVYWAEVLGLPGDGIVVKTYKPRATTGKRKNVHQYGACQIRFGSTDINQQIAGAIEYYMER